ncbi:PTS system, glucose/maltose-specific, IIA component [Clostridium botulinum B str. Osaka05]|uniref:PTS system, glucose/maltose-specific, IIA component n=1 Tax=Clostridium botulinum B str. Osaka05 TaxID=1407017 RepID=A0A0S6TX69_CLOBO|nr:PTS glucose transporter subunit IIA [Clostridium botulinum]GAE00734.1 PTS system, glucose/maltose-specific, IIA component [Clostridium botulinum B str. Osaka05]
MFEIFKKKKLYSPVSGRSVALSNVQDEVFSSLMMGDGIAIDPIDQVIVAPCDCLVKLIMKGSKHALGLLMNNGVEVLIHVGIDTVSLEGEGFEVLVEQGQKVKLGTPLLKFDKDYIISKGYSTMTMMIITEPNGSKISKKYEDIRVQGGETPVIDFC